jgi:hypothetical protein
VSAVARAAHAVIGAILISIPVSILVVHAATAATPAPAEREPCASHVGHRQPFFGDTHVHTTFSFDAWGQGTLAGPDDAYRYAKGERIGIQPYDAEGRALANVGLRRPLDFAVVTDHSDLMGEGQICRDPSRVGHDALVCRVMRRFPALGYALINGYTYANENPSRYSFCGAGGETCLEAARKPWEITQQAAEAHYDRTCACRFTTFVGYEWTGMPAGQNIHRNVIFANEIVQRAPTTYIETPTAEGLWDALERECLDASSGCDAIAIPHNANVSNGLMWTLTGSDGRPLTAAEASRRARLERLVEVSQHKGDSECRAGAEDELCDFETLRYARMQDMETPSRSPALASRIYIREALADGLALQQRIGVNPFKFGLIGSTDTHFATPGMVDEDTHLGHAAGTVSARFGVPPYPDRKDFNPGGLAVLWAEENSRESLFAAMRRREVYGTTGPRIVARFFGGWEYPGDLCTSGDLAGAGYAGGVPMGADLPPLPPPAPLSSGESVARAPRFVVSALRDPGDRGVPSTPLQRIQIIKGSFAGGETHERVYRERVYDVAGGENGADVDLGTCAPRGPGAAALCSVWRDPDFDPDSPAFYYMRVVEDPSCRWNAWVCMRAGVDCAAGRVPQGLDACCDDEVPKTIKERAWTSPIWYTPPAAGGAP